MKNQGYIVIAILFLVAFVTTFGGCGGGGDSGSSAPAPAPVAKAAFVTDTGALKVVPLTGGTPTTLATGVEECLITPDNTKVVYIDSTTNLRVIPIDGGTPTTLDIGVVEFDIALNSATVVYLNSSTNLRSIAISGGTPVVLDTSADDFKISADSTKVVYSVSGILGVRPINGGSATVLVAGGVVDYEIAPNSAKVVYIDNFETITGDLNAIAIIGGSPTVLDLSVFSFEITPDSTKVVYNYYYDGFDTLDMEVISMDGITWDSLATDVSGEFSIAPNSTKVTYIDNYDPITGQGNLNIIPIAGGSATQLGTNVLSCEISPDSNKVVYFRYTAGNQDLYSIPITGGTSSILASDVFYEDAITSDSTKVLYTDNASFVAGTWIYDIKIIPIGGGTPIALGTSCIDADITK